MPEGFVFESFGDAERQTGRFLADFDHAAVVAAKQRRHVAGVDDREFVRAGVDDGGDHRDEPVLPIVAGEALVDFLNGLGRIRLAGQ